MSVPPKGEELPKKGKDLPSRRMHRKRDAEFAWAIATALREELACGASIKTIMGWTGAGERTVKGWLIGANAPRGIHLDGLFRSSDAIYALMIARAGRQQITAREGFEALRSHVTGLLEAIDAVLGQSCREASDC